MAKATAYPLRTYPFNQQKLTEEEIAVIFAMTSRRPEPFDEIQKLVTAEKAADFHERWVLNYGHASVAEHAIIHMAVENLSRLAADTLEDNRLASYTEKSSRYQILPQDYFHVPQELEGTPLYETYVTACQRLFELYGQLVDGIQAHLRTTLPQGENERDGTYNVRLRREATDSCRFVLPSAALTNVGVTLNARSMEHAVLKLLSSELAEERTLGEELKQRGREVTPTLIKYTEPNDYLMGTRKAQQELAKPFQQPQASAAEALLIHYDPDAELKVVAAFLYKYGHRPYAEVMQHVRGMSDEERHAVIDESLSRLGSHDTPVRELESVYYTFELTMDYGAYREFKRHRMQSYMPQPSGTGLGYLTPPLMADAGLEALFDEAMEVSQKGFDAVAGEMPVVAQYLVTHAHRRRAITTMNLRECYHLFKLRTQPTAHFSIRQVMDQAVEQARQVHPALFKHLRLRE
jgi:thymidylate synthase ThyX